MQTQITIGDLTQVRNIVEVAISRGAFKPAELRTVLDTYEKFGMFIAEAEKATAPPVVEEKE